MGVKNYYRVLGVAQGVGKKELRKRLEQVGDGEGDGWGYDVFPFHDDEFSYALGAQVRH